MNRTGTDLTLILPRDTYYQTIHALCAALPPPVTAAAEDRIRRDNAAMAAVASMQPANGDEALLAVQYVAAAAHALDALRLAGDTARDDRHALRCTAQAASMMRQAAAARSLLLRIQAARVKREADHVALDRAAWTEHAALSLMAEALGRPSPAPMQEPPPPLDPAPEPAPGEEPHAPGSAGLASRGEPIRSTSDGGQSADAVVPPRAATTEQRARLLVRVTEAMAKRDRTAPSFPSGDGLPPVRDAGPLRGRGLNGHQEPGAG